MLVVSHLPVPSLRDSTSLGCSSTRPKQELLGLKEGEIQWFLFRGAARKNDSEISLCSVPTLEFWDSNPTGFIIRDRALFPFISHFPSLDSVTLFSLTIPELETWIFLFHLHESWQYKSRHCAFFVLFCFFPGCILFPWLSEHFRGNSRVERSKGRGSSRRGSEGSKR